MNGPGKEFEENTYNKTIWCTHGAQFVHSFSNINEYRAHCVSDCNIALREVLHYVLWGSLAHYFGGTSEWVPNRPFPLGYWFICVTIEYAGVEATSCGVFGIVEQRLQGLD